MRKDIFQIIEKESDEVLKNVLIDLIQMDKRNEERFLLLYAKR